jgi:hypothetical protein
LEATDYLIDKNNKKQKGALNRMDKTIEYIVLGYAASVVLAYAIFNGVWPEKRHLKKRLASALFWPIVLLIVLVVNVLWWLLWRSPVGDAIGEGLAFVGRGMEYLGRGITFVLRPISRLISPLWKRWLDRWPESKRDSIDDASRRFASAAPLAFLAWGLSNTVAAILFGVMAAVGLIRILVIYQQLRGKQVSSS